MLRSAGARRLRKTLKRCPAGAKIAQRIASWTWNVTHERALSPADLFGGTCPWAGRHGSYWLVGYRILDRLVVHRWLGAGRWRTRSKVRAFPRISVSGSPLPRTGRSGDSWLTPFPNLLMPDGWRTSREKMITIALRKRSLSPVRLVLKVTFFCCYMPNTKSSLVNTPQNTKKHHCGK